MRLQIVGINEMHPPRSLHSGTGLSAIHDHSPMFRKGFIKLLNCMLTSRQTYLVLPLRERKVHSYYETQQGGFPSNSQNLLRRFIS